MTGDLNMGANEIFSSDDGKLRLGSGQDLEIYHDGNNSFIKDVGTGNLKILATNLEIRNAADSQHYITANDGGDTILYKAGTEKARTSTNLSLIHI